MSYNNVIVFFKATHIGFRIIWYLEKYEYVLSLKLLVLQILTFWLVRRTEVSYSLNPLILVLQSIFWL